MRTISTAAIYLIFAYKTMTNLADAPFRAGCKWYMEPHARWA